MDASTHGNDEQHGSKVEDTSDTDPCYQQQLINSKTWLDLLASGVSITWYMSMATDLSMEIGLPTITSSGLQPPTLKLYKNLINRDKKIDP